MGVKAKRYNNVVSVGVDAKPYNVVSVGVDAKPYNVVSVGVDAKPYNVVSVGVDAKPYNIQTTTCVHVQFYNICLSHMNMIHLCEQVACYSASTIKKKKKNYCKLVQICMGGK